ncbi:uncharacterized protein [Pocillopora verrucosa]|uniref:uncharacterized protein n=1 Tax=Pocillopora verrucosa TaxID=203993 RepID=UPI00333F9330
MEKIREKCWIPHLRRLTKRVIDECVEYKRFQVTALANPPTGNVPKERTEGSVPFKSIGVDYAGPIKLSSPKRAKYLRKFKDVLWKRWTTEYLKALKEDHNLNHQTEEGTLKEEDMMLIKGEECNRGKWKIGVVEHLIRGRNGVITGA